jgi:hypothetical protein
VTLEELVDEIHATLLKPGRFILTIREDGPVINTPFRTGPSGVDALSSIRRLL